MPPYFSRLGVAENERLGSAPADRAAAAASVPSSTFSCRLLNFPFLNASNRNELAVVKTTKRNRRVPIGRYFHELLRGLREIPDIAGRQCVLQTFQDNFKKICFFEKRPRKKVDTIVGN